MARLKISISIDPKRTILGWFWRTYPRSGFSFWGNIRRNHPFGNHPFVNTKKGHWEIKGRFLKGWFWRTYPRSGFRSGGTSAKTTLLETTLVRTPNPRTAATPEKPQDSEEICCYTCSTTRVVRLRQRVPTHVCNYDIGGWGFVREKKITTLVRDSETTIKLKFALLRGAGPRGQRGKSSKNALFLMGIATTIKF